MHQPDGGSYHPHCIGTGWIVRDSYRRCFARGLATSRAQSIKSCAEGLSARFFSVATPIGPIVGSSIGSALMDRGLVGNLSTDRGRIVRKRPVANRLVLTPIGDDTTFARG